MDAFNNTDKKTISTEELIKSISESGGDFGIQQVVTDADGNKHVTDIYGNYIGDNEEIKQTINVFLDYSTISKLAVAEVKALSDGSDQNSEARYRFSIDIIDEAPHTIVCTSDSKGRKVCTYIRDERRTNSVILESKEWKKGSNIEVTAEILKQDMCLFYMFSAQHLWRLLKKTGKKEILERIGNRGTGILVTSNDGDEFPEFSIRIVQGKNRPDLMCDVFLLGQQMCRPYLDEIIVEPLLEQMTFEQKLKMAESGDPLAMDTVAMSYLNGDDTAQDFSKAFYWYRKIAEMENATAQFNLALFYAKGCGVPRNFDKATEWMLKAADNGEWSAVIEFDKYKNLSKNIEKANDGDPKAQAELAEFYMGLGGSLIQYGNAENDYKEAVRLAENAEKANEPAAFWVLGLAYEHGRGVGADKNKAIAYYKRGSELRHPGCQHNLGCFYLRGDTIKKDEEQGYKLCLKAAKQDHVPAMKTVGNCFQFGTGVNENMSSAIFWYEKYLEKIHDPELEQKVALFKTLPDIGGTRSQDEFYPVGVNKKRSGLNESSKDERNKQIKEALIREMEQSEPPLTIDEFVNSLGWKFDVDNTKISALLTQLIRDGLVVKTYEKKIAYFGLADSFDDERYRSYWTQEEQNRFEKIRKKKEEERKREEEKRKKEQEERRIKEEQRRKEEEKRKAEEERLRKEEAERKRVEDEKRLAEEQLKFEHAQELLERGDMDSLKEATSIFTGITMIAEAKDKSTESKVLYQNLKAKKRKKTFRAILIVVLLIAMIGLGVVYGIPYIQHNNSYKEASALLEQKDYDNAKGLFTDLGEFRDSAEMVKECDYRKATELMNSGNYSEAIDALSDIHDYKDASDLEKICKIEVYAGAAEEKMREGDYEGALNNLEVIANYNLTDYSEKLDQLLYEDAKGLLKEGLIDDASKAVGLIHNQSVIDDSFRKSMDDALAEKEKMQKAEAGYNQLLNMSIKGDGDIKKAEALFSEIPKGYKDIDNMRNVFDHYKGYVGEWVSKSHRSIFRIEKVTSINKWTAYFGNDGKQDNYGTYFEYPSNTSNYNDSKYHTNATLSGNTIVVESSQVGYSGTYERSR